MHNVENLHHINTGVKYTGCQNKLRKNIQIHVCRLINISEFISVWFYVHIPNNDATILFT